MVVDTIFTKNDSIFNQTPKTNYDSVIGVKSASNGILGSNILSLNAPHIIVTNHIQNVRGSFS